MNNLLVLPMALPVITAIILVFFKNYIYIQRTVSVLVMATNTVISFIILNRIQTEGIMRIDFGGWQPPFGILFVADSFAMLLVLTSSFVTTICLLYAMSTIGEAREKMYFYSFVLFLVAGVNGSFLTGDLFNLF